MIRKFLKLPLVLGGLMVFLGTQASSSCPKVSFSEKPKPTLSSSQKPPKTIVILSIDGGGVRGIVPALILQAIERKLPTNSHLTKYFHIMSGTSTGALICLLLNKTHDEERNVYHMMDIIRIYKTLSKEVFTRSVWQWISSGAGLFAAKYDAKSFENYLLNYLGHTKISETPIFVLVPAFELKTRRMKFFRTQQAKKYARKDYYLKDVARATSAAPTYFEAAYIKNIFDRDEGIYVDGGVGANNPTVSAIVHALEIYGRNKEIFVLSIGTGTTFSTFDDNVEKLKLDIRGMGKVEWASQIIDVLMGANTDVTHFYALVGLRSKYYYRIQLTLDEECMQLDDGSPENMERLSKITNEFIQENDPLITEIANHLMRLQKINSF